MGKDRYKIIESEHPYFCTCTIKDWFPLFTNPEIVEIIINNLKFLQKDGLKIYAFVIMENHLHLIVQSSDLIKDMQRFKSFTATDIVDYLKLNFQNPLLRKFKFKEKSKHRKHKIWEEGYHPIMIANREIMIQKIEYIHNNPVRRGYVDDTTNWVYSSSRNYAGQKGIMKVVTDW